MAQTWTWKVTGGIGKGGVLVRAGQDLASDQLSERLSTGSVVKQLELVGERLHYALVEGSGPPEGWVSTRISGKELLVRKEILVPEFDKVLHKAGIFNDVDTSELRQKMFGVQTFQNVDTKLTGNVNAAELTTNASPTPSASNQQDGVQQLAPGCTARISGLKSASHLNGCLAVLRQLDPSGSGRWQVDVQLEGGRTELKAIRPENLTPEKASPLQEAIARVSASLAELETVKSTRSTGDTGYSAYQEAELRLRRGHLYWADLRYTLALRDFEDAEAAQPGGIATPSLLALNFCVGIGPAPATLRGHDELRRLVERLTTLRRTAHDEFGDRMHIFFPRESDPEADCNSRRSMASAGMRIFDGSCHIDVLGAYPEADIGYRILANCKSPAKDTPLIVYFHGNGEVCTDYTGWAELYENFPCTFIVFDYRGYGWSTGVPRLGTLTKDAEQCVKKLPEIFRRHSLQWPWPAPMILHGRSLGSAVVTNLAAKFPDMFSGLIVDAGMSSDREANLQKFIDGAGDDREEVVAGLDKLKDAVLKSLPAGCEIGQEPLSPIGTCEQVRSFRGQVLVIHAMMDTLVPAFNGERNYAAAVNAHSREHVTLWADHNSMASQKLYWRKQMDFVQTALTRWRSENNM